MGRTSVTCPKCGVQTDQSPCWSCSYEFPPTFCPECGKSVNYTIEEREDRITLYEKWECPECGYIKTNG